MKMTRLLTMVRMMMRVASHYCGQHAISLSAIHGNYTKRWIDPTYPDKKMRSTLKIVPYGSWYQISHILYKNDEIQKEETCLASYGWHSNGHLIEIGGYRYWIFNPLQQVLYVEDSADDGTKTIDIYIKN